MYNGPVLYIEYQNGDTQVVEGSSVHRIVKQVKKHLGE